MAALLHLVRATTAGLIASALALTAAPFAPAVTLGADHKPVTNAAGTRFGILSHRGGAMQWPENSVEAYTNSVAEKFDTIETDIVFTSDGQAVMSHYDVLPERCTGTGQSIHQLTWAQVSEIRCENLATPRQKAVPIPTFQQLAGILTGHADVGLTLDMKSYPGQKAAEKRLWAKRAIKLVRDHGLLAQTSVISFYWADTLPTIRKYAPKTYVLALDTGKMDLDRVRLADRLGASGYGIKMKYTSTYLATYVKKKGMDSTPWEVTDFKQRAFTIAYGGKLQLFSTDTPTATRADLLAGRINLNPTPVPTVTPLPAPVTISSGTYKARKRQYPVVLGKAVPAEEVAMLKNVTMAITVTGGKGKGSLYVGAMSSALSSAVKVRLPKGTRTLTVTAPLGDHGKLRIYTTRKVKLAVQVVSYTRVLFA